MDFKLFCPTLYFTIKHCTSTYIHTCMCINKHSNIYLCWNVSFMKQNSSLLNSISLAFNSQTADKCGRHWLAGHVAEDTMGWLCMLSLLQAPCAPSPPCLYTRSFCPNPVLSSPLLFKNQLQHSLWKFFPGPCLLPCAPLNSVPPPSQRLCWL